jgi:hypothetical protein
VGRVACAKIRVAARVPGGGDIGFKANRLAQFGNRLGELACRGEVSSALLVRFGGQSRT